MKTIAILDTETTGLDPARDRCIEVACVLYSVEHAAAIVSFSTILRASENAAEEVNRIPASLLRGPYAPDNVAECWKRVAEMCAPAEAIVAHRAEFDRGFVDASIRDLRPWICSKFDMEWPLGKPGDHLVHLALAHGLGVVHAHRALTDCDTLCRLFMRVQEMGHDIPAMLARAMLPRVRIVSLAPFEQKDEVKALGFAWDPDRRQWWRRCIVGEVPAYPFAVREEP